MDILQIYSILHQTNLSGHQCLGNNNWNILHIPFWLYFRCYSITWWNTSVLPWICSVLWFCHSSKHLITCFGHVFNVLWMWVIRKIKQMCKTSGFWTPHYEFYLCATCMLLGERSWAIVFCLHWKVVLGHDLRRFTGKRCLCSPESTG